MRKLVLVIVFLLATPLNAQWLSRGVSVRKLMAPPKFSVSDNFNRANGSLTSPWVKITNTSGVPSINNNSVFSAGLFRTSAYWSTATFSDNQYAELKVGTCANGWGTVVVRSSTTTETYYSAGIGTGLTGYWTPYIVKYVSGNQAVVYAGASTRNTLPSFISLEAVGNVFTLYYLSAHGGTKTLVSSVTDSSIASGYPGIMFNAQYGCSSWDDFYAGDL